MTEAGATTGQQIERLREIAKRVRDLADDPVQNEKRDLWRRHNSLENTRPLIYARAFAWREVVSPSLEHVCTDPLYAAMEDSLLELEFRGTTGDDYVVERHFPLAASLAYPSDRSRRWGPSLEEVRDTATGAFLTKPCIESEADLDLLRAPHHEIDEATTAERWERASEAIGDILPVAVNRFPLYINFEGDVSTDLAKLRGLERMMLDMYDNPDLLHRLAGFLSDATIAVQDEAEAAGDLRMINSSNQAMAYGGGLVDPTDAERSAAVGELWGFLAAQEFALVSPQMHDEFLLEYQIPIMERFGLCAYGCCEDLTAKIDILRRIPNLRRIAVTPWADIERSAEQIGSDYVLSWRPSPAEMISRGIDEAYVRREISAADEIFGRHGCVYDITLKDVHRIGGDPENVRRWVSLVRETIGAA
ncbi:MAG: hypothetical protein ACOC2D_20470 [Spirochaetota bacterium]